MEEDRRKSMFYVLMFVLVYCLCLYQVVYCLTDEHEDVAFIQPVCITFYIFPKGVGVYTGSKSLF